ncbi:PREDICTED: uncharacterized protein K02A2.6-like [Priapulus caudatus]|uniref:RNA-directed DNA polymerase n=1 Tax=Priapulus caudatus TaxID=37621 RepID=A0ABM1EU82_PRICU|nr:PREDICTED: uncharacterized protein K02A2.6-like [Priapulus caudatus]
MGWPNRIQSVPEDVKAFYSVRSELSVSKDLLLYRNRTVIPTEWRRDILSKIHEGHQGITKCREHAKMSVWWQEIGQDIAHEISTCQFCQTNRPTQQKKPLITTPLPARPWQKVGMDLCELEGKRYLVVIDYYSRYLEVMYVPEITSKQVIGKLKNLFARWGIPEEVVSDNGAQFTSTKFRLLQSEYNFIHTTSSPHFPQANDLKSVKMTDDRAKTSYRRFYNRRHSVKSLPEHGPGDMVRVKLDKEKGWKTTGVVVSQATTPRSYIVTTDGLATMRQNRRHLKVSLGDDVAVPVESQDTPMLETVPSSGERTETPEDNAHEMDVESHSPGPRTSGRVVHKPLRFRDDIDK